MVTNRIQLSKKIEWDRQRKISFFGYFKTIDDLKTKSEEKIEVLKNLRIQTPDQPPARPDVTGLLYHMNHTTCKS